MLGDTIPIAEALERCEDDRARDKIAAARARVAAEFARLPPAAAAHAADPGVREIYVDPAGGFIVDRRVLSLAEAFPPYAAPAPRGTPALAPWRRAKQDEARVTAAERARSMLDRIAAGRPPVFFLRTLADPGLVGPFSGDRVRGARLIEMRGDLVLLFPDGSIGWKPRVALPPATEPEAGPQRQASIWEIRETARAVYAEERAAGRPAPNINEAEALIRVRCNAGRGLIRPVLAECEFDALRGRPGVRRT